MGFLLGAFGKLAAGRRVRQLQSQMMRVQSRLRRATRQAADMEKQLQRNEKAELNNLSAYSQMVKQNTQQGLLSNIIGGANGAIWQKGQTDASSLSDSERSLYSTLVTGYQTSLSNFNATSEMNVSMMKTEIENKYESMREMLLEPLKDEEDMLQTEKDSLESQIQIAQADYEACKKMEQADAKNLAPNYTGQG